jgi:hypothetical protein
MVKLSEFRLSSELGSSEEEDEYEKTVVVIVWLALMLFAGTISLSLWWRSVWYGRGPGLPLIR